MIRGLAARRTYLTSTDHLSDRQLYDWLWNDALMEETKDLPPDSGWNCHICVLGGWSEEDTLLHYRYHADDRDRADWMKSFPTT